MFKKLLFLSFICVQFLQAQDSLNMVRMAKVGGMPGNEYNDIWGYTDEVGKEYAIIGSSQAINIFDVTDCSNPVPYYEKIDGTNTIWRDFKTYDHYVYGICDGGSCNEGLEIINMEDSTFSQSTTDFVRAHNVYVDEPNARLYVVGSNTVNEGMIIYDLSVDPGNPTLLKKVKLDTLPGLSTSLNLYIHDIYVKDNIAYASHGYAGYYIWDVSDVENITKLADIDDLPGYNHSSWLDPQEEYAYVAEELPKGRPISIYKKTVTNDLIYKGEFKDPLEAPNYSDNRPHNPYIVDDKLYISYYHDGIVVYDIKDRENPQVYGYYDTYSDNNGNGYGNSGSFEGAWGVYPFLASGCILASDITYGLYTLNIKLGEVEQSDGDFVILDSDIKIVLPDVFGNKFEISIDANDDLIVNPYVATNPVTKLNKSDYKLAKSAGGIFIKTENGVKKIYVDTNGDVQVVSASLPTSEYVQLGSNDFITNDAGKGLILTDANGDCWKLRIHNGALASYKSPCWD